jgi:hypothetical protein
LRNGQSSDPRESGNNYGDPFGKTVYQFCKLYSIETRVQLAYQK